MTVKFLSHKKYATINLILMFALIKKFDWFIDLLVD